MYNNDDRVLYDDDNNDELNLAHTNPETLNMDCVFDENHIMNRVIGSNRRIKIVPMENMSVIYNIYSLVRQNFLQQWRAALTVTNVRHRVSTCVAKTLRCVIDQYYTTSYGKSYFDKIELISCDNRLFNRHKEWIMPATDTDKFSSRLLYLLIDRAEIERFIAYYLYVYSKSGVSVSVEFDTVCDKVKSMKRKKPTTYLNGSINKPEKQKEKPDDDDNNDNHSTIFYFTLMCIDKTLSILNNMIMNSGGVPRKIYATSDKRTVRTSIIDILDTVSVVAADRKKHDEPGNNRGELVIYK